VGFAAIILCVASERMFIVVSVYFVIDSVRKFLVTPSYVYLGKGHNFVNYFLQILGILNDVSKVNLIQKQTRIKVYGLIL
jgi:hypothetical protein